MASKPISDLNELLDKMTPELKPDPWAFVCVPHDFNISGKSLLVSYLHKS